MDEEKVIVNDENIEVAQEEEAGLITPDVGDGVVACCNAN